jgi:hypothetical protein
MANDRRINYIERKAKFHKNGYVVMVDVPTIVILVCRPELFGVFYP